MIQAAVAALHKGGIIAYPTEAVFGLGCDPRNTAALERIIDLKGRDTHKGFIVIASNQAQLHDFMAPVSAQQQSQLDKYWPGPVTVVVPANTQTSNSLLTGFRTSLAVRVSSHPVVVELCDQFGGAIVSTSANRTGEPSLRSYKAVMEKMGQELDSVVDAPVGELESATRIYELASGKQLR